MHERLEFTPPRLRADRVRRAPDGRRDASARGSDIEQGAPATHGVVPFMTDVPGRDGGPLVPGPGLAPLPGRVELPHRPGVRRQPAASRSSGCPTARTARACSTRSRTSRPARQPGRRSTRACRPTTSRRAASRCPRTTRRPRYTGLEEDLGVHLQAFRLGDILFTVCSCEQWADQALQHQDAHRPRRRATSTSATTGRRAVQRDDAPTATWTLPEPGDDPSAEPAADLAIDEVSSSMQRAGEQPRRRLGRPGERCRTAESEPTDPTQIKGNFTHDELPRAPRLHADRPDLDGQRLQRLHRDATASTSAATTTARR